MHRIIHFIQYHNAFTLTVVFVFLAGTFAFANEDVRDAVLGESFELKEGIDNTAILQANLDEFDLNLRILGVEEDELYYFIIYQFTTLGIEDHAWQQVVREKVLKIDKLSLKEADLRAYIAEELNEVAEQELAYLREVQKIERAKGSTQFTASVERTGLIGLLADLKDAVFQERVAQEQSVVQLFGEFNPAPPAPLFEERPLEFLPFDFSEVLQESFSSPEPEVKEEEDKEEVNAEQNAEASAKRDTEESAPPAKESASEEPSDSRESGAGEEESSPAPVEENTEPPAEVKEVTPEKQEPAAPQEEPVKEESAKRDTEESVPPAKESASEESSDSRESGKQESETSQTVEQE